MCVKFFFSVLLREQRIIRIAKNGKQWPTLIDSNQADKVVAKTKNESLY